VINCCSFVLSLDNLEGFCPAARIAVRILICDGVMYHFYLCLVRGHMDMAPG
jgi:hypothetical protein